MPFPKTNIVFFNNWFTAKVAKDAGISYYFYKNFFAILASSAAIIQDVIS